MAGLAQKDELRAWDRRRVGAPVLEVDDSVALAPNHLGWQRAAGQPAGKAGIGHRRRARRPPAPRGLPAIASRWAAGIARRVETESVRLVVAVAADRVADHRDVAQVGLLDEGHVEG